MSVVPVVNGEQWPHSKKRTAVAMTWVAPFSLEGQGEVRIEDLEALFEEIHAVIESTAAVHSA